MKTVADLQIELVETDRLLTEIGRRLEKSIHPPRKPGPLKSLLRHVTMHDVNTIMRLHPSGCSFYARCVNRNGINTVRFLKHGGDTEVIGMLYCVLKAITKRHSGVDGVFDITPEQSGDILKSDGALG